MYLPFIGSNRFVWVDILRGSANEIQLVCADGTTVAVTHALVECEARRIGKAAFAARSQGRNQVFAPPLPCRRLINARRKTLLKRSWQADETCSISEELTRRIVTCPSALIEACRLAPLT